ncbi:MAG: tetratricopeptide repeat protein, partial [Helicobacter sp.]|nr:tetratricopeptide repeat protein [Helicobacter sp.]
MTAAQLYKEGKYQEALVAYNALVQTNPVAANYLGLAQCYQKLGYTIHAIEALNEGIAKYPQNLDLQLCLAQTHFSAHNLDAAKEILEPLYASNKENLIVVALYLNYCIA